MENNGSKEKNLVKPGEIISAERLENETMGQFTNRMHQLGRGTFYELDLRDDRGQMIKEMSDYIGKDDDNNGLYLVREEFVDKVDEVIKEAWEERDELDRMEAFDDYDDYDL